MLDTTNSDSIKPIAQRYATWIGRQTGLPQKIFYDSEPLIKMVAEKAAKAMGGTTDLLQRLDAPGWEPFTKAAHQVPSHCHPLMLITASTPFYTQLNGFIPDISKQAAGYMQLLCLQLDGGWNKFNTGGLNLVAAITPDRLPTEFPYPDLSGSELRPRPAYYYRQSAVIPFRRQINGDRVEVLLVSSSKKRHWLVPKGIHEPGLSAQESARIEAYEEAGVEGRVIPLRLGQYQHQKWGGNCTVEVYPLLVNKVLSESDWIESHRDRRWCTIEEAKSLLTIPELNQMLDKLPRC